MIRLGERKPVWTALFLGVFCFFAINNAILSYHTVSTTDCPMKVECKACSVSVWEDFSNSDMIFPVSCGISIATQKLAFRPVAPALPPPIA